PAVTETVNIGQRFPPQVLRQYALLADGERGALVGPHGDIAWMCAPRWDSDAVFSTLIGGGGTSAATPQSSHYAWGGYYETGSLIWHSRWIVGNDVVECWEALAFPGDVGRVVLLRRIVAQRGQARVNVLFDPRAEFGRYSARHISQHDGIWTGQSG